jgi:hypothetical protein
MTVDGHSDSLDTDVDTGWALWENYDPATGTGTIPTGSGRFWCGAYPLCASCVETWKRLSAAGYLGMRGGNEGATVGSANGKDGERYLSWDDTTNVMNIANYPMASLVGDWDDDPTEDEVRANVRDMIGTAMLGGRWMMSTFAHNPKQPGITSGCDLDEFRWIFDEIADNGRIWNASWDDAVRFYRSRHAPVQPASADTASQLRGVTWEDEIYWAEVGGDYPAVNSPTAAIALGDSVKITPGGEMSSGSEPHEIRIKWRLNSSGWDITAWQSVPASEIDTETASSEGDTLAIYVQMRDSTSPIRRETNWALAAGVEVDSTASGGYKDIGNPFEQ